MMTRQAFSRLGRRKSAALLTAVVALSQIGAAAHDFAPIGKDDRPASIADCREAIGPEADRCRGVTLPTTAADPIKVMPGLTVVDQVSG